MKDIQLSLTLDEVNAILQSLGQTPTSSNLWPLFIKIKQQAEAVLAEQEKTQ